ncbi:MAG TPA: hypothetical protein PLV68_05180, partial [Ilumatobacteraceae bacterium]|nr:hypothetical protein [Ilumatobacteraceae bacterium]
EPIADCTDVAIEVAVDGQTATAVCDSVFPADTFADVSAVYSGTTRWNSSADSTDVDGLGLVPTATELTTSIDGGEPGDAIRLAATVTAPRP